MHLIRHGEGKKNAKIAALTQRATHIPVDDDITYFIYVTCGAIYARPKTATNIFGSQILVIVRKLIMCCIFLQQKIQYMIFAQFLHAFH